MKNIIDELKKRVIVADGAMGTELQKYDILKSGESPESLNLTNPGAILGIHKNYIDAGAEIIVTNSFGANRIKLSDFGLDDKVAQINTNAVTIAAKAAEGRAVWVAGSIGPTGKFVEPNGELTFAEAIAVFSEQAELLCKAGANLITLETFMDIKELKAALIAVKSVTDIPVIAMMTFTETERTLLGTTPEAAAVVADALGADVIGANCGLGTDKIYSIVSRMAAVTNKPLIAQPNAGLPRFSSGKIKFQESSEDMLSSMKNFSFYPSIIKGCCGTDPSYIRLIKSNIEAGPHRNSAAAATRVASASDLVEFGYERPFVMIGERMNPTGKQLLREALVNNKTAPYRQEAAKQVAEGARILDLNVGAPGVDEVMLMHKMVLTIESVVSAPLVIDSPNSAALESGLTASDGKSIINSVNGTDESIKTVLPLAKKYGAAVIVLLLDKKIPKTAEGRLKIAERIVRRADLLGIPRENLIADPLTLTVGSEGKSVNETLKTIKLIKERLGISTTMGLSNVSYGLPQRTFINAAFLAMAMENGLDSAICNPDDRLLHAISLSSDMIKGRKDSDARYIKHAPDIKIGTTSGIRKKAEFDNPFDEDSSEAKLYTAIIEGSDETIDIASNLLNKMSPSEILETVMIEALQTVGTLYEKKIYFLPQMIKSANSAKRLAKHLKQFIAQDKTSTKGTVVMATVKGDIHDIGKNIVALMLENAGYRVIDLGKDVENKDIVEAAVKYKADIVGLSALMTTTMQQMGNVIKLLKKHNIPTIVMVGGAAVNSDFAKSIGAEGYSEDAVSAVRLADLLIKGSYGKAGHTKIDD